MARVVVVQLGRVGDLVQTRLCHFEQGVFPLVGDDRMRGVQVGLWMCLLCVFHLSLSNLPVVGISRITTTETS